MCTEDQDQFDELQFDELEYADTLSSSDVSDSITQSFEMRATEIDELLHLITIFTRQQRRTVAPADLASSTGRNSVLPHTELPLPSRYARRIRAAGTRSFAN